MIERDAVRAAIVDGRGRILLLHIRDLSNFAFGTSWELPGGGVDSGESPAEAVAREVLEETGICVCLATMKSPAWHRDVIYSYRGERRLQHELVFLIQLEGISPSLQTTRRVGFEHEDYIGCRWWTVEEIIASDARFYPRSLPQVIQRLILGEQINEGIEIWD
jgi:8-oxo-dGTP pyrophosphatase MutT (NUDIX family)